MFMGKCPHRAVRAVVDRLSLHIPCQFRCLTESGRLLRPRQDKDGQTVYGTSGLEGSPRAIAALADSQYQFSQIANFVLPFQLCGPPSQIIVRRLVIAGGAVWSLLICCCSEVTGTPGRD